MPSNLRKPSQHCISERSVGKLDSSKKHTCPKDALLPHELKQELLSVNDPREKEYRITILAAIERNIQTKGAHLAQPHDTRARQFMPFAALKGYADMVQEEKHKH